MFWVSKAEERTRSVVIIDGQLSGDDIEAVETCCDQAIATGKPVDLVCAMSQQSTKPAARCSVASPQGASAYSLVAFTPRTLCRR